MKKRILITGVGGPSPRSFAISLKKYSNYADFEIIGTDSNKYAVGLYQKELYDYSYLIPRADSDEYWPIIKKIIEKHNIDYAVILPEVEALEWSKVKEKGDLPCTSLISDYELNKVLIDKAQMTEILRPLGVVPRSIEIDRDQESFDQLFNMFNSDFWIRSSTGTSGLGSLKIENAKQLKDWIKINPNVNKFLASEFLPGRNLACKLLYYNGELMRAAIGERVYYIMSKVAPSGVTGNTSFGRLLNDSNVFEVAKRSMDILFEKTNSKKHGFFTVDLKDDESGNPLVTEVNIRHVAFSQCFSACGANFPEDTIRLLDNDTTFDKNFKLYEFEEGTIFLRDVDSLPIIMKEDRLLSQFNK